MNLIKKGATDVTRYIVLVDSAAGTPETAYTISSLDLQYTRNRTAPAAKVDAVALAATDTAHTDNRAIEIDAVSSPGLYRIDWPDAAFATGVDKVMLVVSGAGLHPAYEEIQLVNFDPEDGVRLGLTALPNAAADAAGGLPISDAGGLDLDAKLANTHEITAARMGALTDWIDGGRLDLLLDAVKAKTDQFVFTIANKVDSSIQAAGDFAQAAADKVWATATRVLTAGTNIVLAKGVGVTGFNDLSAAQVNTEVDTALADIHLDHLLAVDYDPAAKPGVATALLNELIESDAGVSRYTANALEQAPTGGSAPTAAEVADAVWDEASADHVGAGSTGERLERLDIIASGGAGGLTNARAVLLDNLDAAVSTRATPAQVNTEVDTALADYDGPTSAELVIEINSVQADIAALNNLSSAQAQTAAAAALTAYDPPTRAEATADKDEILADTVDLQARLPAALTGAGHMKSDVLAIDGETSPADKLAEHAKGVLKIVVGVGSTTTAVKVSTVDGGAPSATNDFYNGRVFVFLTGTLAGQATDIADYVGSTTTATVTAVTGAPASGDTAVLV